MHAGRARTYVVLIVLSLLVALSPRSAAADWLGLDDPELASGRIALSLRAAHSRASWGQRETVGSVSLVVPLERLAAPPRATRTAIAEETAPAPAPEARAREIQILLSPDLARAAVRAALRAAGHPASQRRLDGLASRASSSALLPELRLRGARTTDESLRLTPTQSDPYRHTQAGGSSLTLEARLTWKLDRLVFADEEIDVERLRGQRAVAARALVREVLRTLVSWQRAKIRSEDPDLPPEERLDALLAAVEAEATLDVLTNGWFSARLERRPVAKRRHTR